MKFTEKKSMIHTVVVEQAECTTFLGVRKKVGTGRASLLDKGRLFVEKVAEN